MGAVAAGTIVGVAVVIPGAPSSGDAPTDELVAVGVAPAWRGGGLGGTLVRAAVAGATGRERGLVAVVGAGERDPVEPLDLAVRRRIAERLLTGAGLRRDRLPAGGSAVERYLSRPTT